MTTVLVTRPLNQAGPTIARIEAMGLKAVPAPLSRLRPVEFEVIGQPAVLVVTSLNGVHYGLPKFLGNQVAVYAVGKRTAAAAREMGFNTVYEGDGTGKSLANLIKSLVHADKGTIAHLSGDHIAYDIVTDLVKHGYLARRYVCYETHPLNLSAANLQKISSGEITCVLFYSARTVAIFEEEIRKADLVAAIGSLRAHVMSQRIAGACQLTWQQITIAKEQNEDSLLAGLSC